MLQERIEKMEKELAELKVLAKKEEFKKGDWVIMTDSYAGVLFEGEVYQIICLQVEGNDWYVLNHDGENSKYAPNKNSFRKATTSEIESHLIKEAEKKGFVKGATINQVPAYGYGTIQTLKENNYSYDHTQDNLWCGDYGIYKE